MPWVKWNRVFNSRFSTHLVSFSVYPSDLLHDPAANATSGTTFEFSRKSPLVSRSAFSNYHKKSNLNSSSISKFNFHRKFSHQKKLNERDIYLISLYVLIMIILEPYDQELWFSVQFFCELLIRKANKL